MLPIQLFRQEKELVLAGLKKKNFKDIELVDKIIALDEKRRELQVENDNLAAKLNAAAKSIGIHMSKGEKHEAEQLKEMVNLHKEQAKDIAQKLADMETEQQDMVIKLPNLPHNSVPVGKTPEENEVVRSGGKMPALGEHKMPHWDLATKYELIDFELGKLLLDMLFVDDMLLKEPLLDGEIEFLVEGLELLCC